MAERCPFHDSPAHGAEELRAGIELILEESGGVGHHIKDELRRLLDRVDARDALAHLEAVERLQEERDEARERAQTIVDEAFGLHEELNLNEALTVIEREHHAQRIRLQNQVLDLERELATLRQAIGLATTAVPALVMDPADPVGMMQKVVAEVGRLREVSKARPEVLAFARAMEAKLRANEHKGGWQEDSSWALLDRLREETNELADALAAPVGNDVAGWRSRILGEAADIGNFAMMVADVVGARGDAR